MRTSIIVLGCCLMALSGCPADEEGASEGEGSEGSGSEGSGSTTTAGTSTAGQSETSAGTSATSTTSAGTDTSAGTEGSGSATTAVDEGSTGAGDPCNGLSREECNAEPDCMPITCSPYVMGPDPGVTPWCIGDQEFLECVTMTGCDDVRTVACEGDDAPAYACPSSCIPPGWNECSAPAEGEIPMCM
jgi:hypothetical protein